MGGRRKSAGPLGPNLIFLGHGGGGARPHDLILPTDGLCATHLAHEAKSLTTTGVAAQKQLLFLKKIKAMFS